MRVILHHDKPKLLDNHFLPKYTHMRTKTFSKRMVSIQNYGSIVLLMLEFDRILHKDIVQQEYQSTYSLFYNRSQTKTVRINFQSIGICSKRN